MIIISAYAFSKLSWFRTNCNDDNVANMISKHPQFLEVSLMGVSKSDTELGHIVDFVCVPQECSSGLTDPDDDGMNTYLESMMLDKEISIVRCGRFWAHTHPGTSPAPSSTDNETFEKWFGHSDLGVMYILANGDDSCKVKHGSKYFGMNIENMSVFVELDALDQNGNKILLSTKTLFAIDKIGMADKYEQLSATMYNSYSHKEAEWMEELRVNVKKKTYPTVNTHHNQYGQYNQQYNHQLPANRTITTPPSPSTLGIGRTNSTVRSRITASDIIKLLVQSDKNTINEFSKEEKVKINAYYNSTLGDLQLMYNEVLKFEKSFDFREIFGWEIDFIDQDGKSKFEEIAQNKHKLSGFCTTFMVRPSHLKETIEEYIKEMQKTPRVIIP